MSELFRRNYLAHFWIRLPYVPKMLRDFLELLLWLFRGPLWSVQPCRSGWVALVACPFCHWLLQHPNVRSDAPTVSPRSFGIFNSLMFSPWLHLVPFLCKLLRCSTLRDHLSGQWHLKFARLQGPFPGWSMLPFFCSKPCFLMFTIFFYKIHRGWTYVDMH